MWAEVYNNKKHNIPNSFCTFRTSVLDTTFSAYSICLLSVLHVAVVLVVDVLVSS
jgi:hypothetical protein